MLFRPGSRFKVAGASSLCRIKSQYWQMLKSIDTCVPHLSSKEDRKLVVQRDTLGGLGVSSGWHPTTLA